MGYDSKNGGAAPSCLPPLHFGIVILLLLTNVGNMLQPLLCV